MAPPKWRGAFNIGFQLFIAIGILTANLINYGVATIKGNYGWRLSLGLAGVPAIIMTVGALLVPDSVSSLIERDRMQDARHALRKVRGSGVDIEPELQFFIDECERASAVKKPFMNIIKRQYRPQLVMCIAIPFFQQVGGIDVIAFYAPVIFRSLGLGSMTALLAAVILASVNFCSILVSMVIVDRHGRRVLFFAGGTQMFIFQVAMAVALAVLIGSAGDKPIAKSGGILMLVFMCLYASGFGWSWGPLSWLVPSEISPLEIRPAGQSISVSVNLAVTFILSQTFLAMLCNFRYGTFLFWAGWILVMTIFVATFLPETKGIPLGEIQKVWAGHWYWKKFVKEPLGGGKQVEI